MFFDLSVSECLRFVFLSSTLMFYVLVFVMCMLLWVYEVFHSILIREKVN